MTITLPPSGERYLSVALMDMYSNSFAVLGTRTTGRDCAVVTYVGPGASARDPMTLRAPTRWVWLLARTLVDGEADLVAALAVKSFFVGDQMHFGQDRLDFVRDAARAT